MKNTLAFLGMTFIFSLTTANAIGCPSEDDLRNALSRSSIRQDIQQQLVSSVTIAKLETVLKTDNIVVTPIPEAGGTTCVYSINDVAVFKLIIHDENYKKPM